VSRGGLVALLAEHPFGDDEGLLHTAIRTVTAGAARRAAATADDLRRLGVGPGQGVAVQLPDGPDAVTTLFGVWEAGAVLVPVNHRLPPDEVDRVVAATRPAVLVGPGGPAVLERPVTH
jgi:long-chain acyl-CoA synthetase